MTKMNQLSDLGQAIWIDFIERAFLNSGGLQALIDQGLRGLTSNPTIFEKAIAHSNAYDQAFKNLAGRGAAADKIYTTLTVEDIQYAADLFRPLYDRTSGADGYVSLEVNPILAHQTLGTAAEAMHLWSLVNRPNLMIKIPATPAGLPAITQVIAEGINVNVTLIFSLTRYQDVMDAYLKGIEQRLEAGQPVDRIHSVASFFISRLDSKVDKRLETIIKNGGLQAEQAAALRGKAAVANARLAYSLFKGVIGDQRFMALQARGANLQRPLWASTSTKNPAYSDILYVQELIGPHTVNTVPPETLAAFAEHGEPRLTLESGLEEARTVFTSLQGLGIAIDQVTQELEDEGVKSFAASFEALMASIAAKRAACLREA